MKVASWLIPKRKLSLKTLVVVVALFVLLRQMSSILSPSRWEKRIAKESDSKAMGVARHNVRFAVIAQDASRKYKIHSYLVASEAMVWGKVQQEDVTIATHCTDAEVALLAALAERWSAPISVAVVTGDVASLLSTITNLRRCYPPVKQHVSFHIAVRTDGPEADSDPDDLQAGDEMGLKVPCNVVMMDQGLIPSESKNETYPTNLLRNIARKETITKFIFPLDIDFLPSGELEQNFKAFMQERSIKAGFVLENEERVFVTPSFEVHSEQTPMVPKYKAELLQSWDQNYISPQKSFINYNQWRNIQMGPERGLYLNIAYETEPQSPWGVYFIGSRDMPMYDEAFTGSTDLSRASQICELHLAGYKFAVLDDAFVVQKRFKSNDTSLDAEGDNSRLQKFEHDLRRQYPDSSRHCV